MHSWAYNNDRGLPYLLSCFKRLPSATAADRCGCAAGWGGEGAWLSKAAGAPSPLAPAVAQPQPQS